MNPSLSPPKLGLDLSSGLFPNELGGGAPPPSIPIPPNPFIEETLLEGPPPMPLKDEDASGPILPPMPPGSFLSIEPFIGISPRGELGVTKDPPPFGGNDVPTPGPRRMPPGSFLSTEPFIAYSPDTRFEVAPKNSLSGDDSIPEVDPDAPLMNPGCFLWAEPTLVELFTKDDVGLSKVPTGVSPNCDLGLPNETPFWDNGIPEATTCRPPTITLGGLPSDETFIEILPTIG
mmetsp:Transcript_34561/g.65768  ORF Transcript_34561/g.65768 Transcript_34561/m.65768 type:complete len:232 (-) Transcript_34561:49-744(-)